MPRLTHDRYCDEVAAQVDLLRMLVTSGADLSATVPTCPDWTLEQLLRHLGGVLRWVEAVVGTRSQEFLPPDSVPGHAGPDGTGDPAALDAWLAESGRTLVRTLREAGPDVKVWSWAGPRDSGFWARRMTHEITVHRADAELTVGTPYDVAAEVAVDAVDEWLELVEVRRRRRGERAQAPSGPYRTVHLHATDASEELDAEWLVGIGERGMEWRRGHEKATVVLRGPLVAVLLAFYRRLPVDAPGLEVLGDRAVLDDWLDTMVF